MERRRGQHDAQLREARRDAGGDGRRGHERQQDDRALGRLEHRRGRGVHAAQRARLGDVRAQDGERLLRAALRLAQKADREVVGGVADDLVASEALEGDRVAPQDGVCRRVERGVVAARLQRRRQVVERRPVTESRPAPRTRDGLRVKAPVRGVAVLARAVLAHREPAHARVRPVVRQVADDAEARAAVRAVGERIMEPPARGARLGEALGAGGEVGQQHGGARTGAVVVADLEAREAGGLEPGVLDRVDVRDAGRVRSEPREEALEPLARPLDLDENAARVVGHPAREFQFSREPVDERAEPDALHGAAHLGAQSRGVGPGGRYAGGSGLTKTGRVTHGHSLGALEIPAP